VTASSGRPAVAQPAPKFEFEKPPDKPVEWTVQSKGGVLVTTGNSQSRSVVLGLAAGRKAGDNKVSLEGSAAYGHSNILVPVLTSGEVTGFDRQGETTTNEWRTRARYDRFFTANNAAYVLAQIAADKIAGKRLYGGGQIGYSRQLVKTERHTTVAELGYDFSYESYVQQEGRDLDPVSIHSARVFAGELFAVTPQTGLALSLEALFNLNTENAPDASSADGLDNEVAPFADTRLLGKVTLTTMLWKNVSAGLGFTLKYDQNPAPRPVPASAKGAKYAAGFHPFADRWDTLTELSLVVTFL
jgi:hypothetical protein